MSRAKFSLHMEPLDVLVHIYALVRAAISISNYSESYKCQTRKEMWKCRATEFQPGQFNQRLIFQMESLAVAAAAPSKYTYLPHCMGGLRHSSEGSEDHEN